MGVTPKAQRKIVNGKPIEKVVKEVKTKPIIAENAKISTSETVKSLKTKPKPIATPLKSKIEEKSLTETPKNNALKLGPEKVKNIKQEMPTSPAPELDAKTLKPPLELVQNTPKTEKTEEIQKFALSSSERVKSMKRACTTPNKEHSPQAERTELTKGFCNSKKMSAVTPKSRNTSQGKIDVKAAERPKKAVNDEFKSKAKAKTNVISGMPLCSRNFQNVKLRPKLSFCKLRLLFNLEIREFICHSILREINFC